MRRFVPLTLLIFLFSPTHAATPITIDHADELLAKLPGDPWTATHDASTLAWLEAPILHGLLDLYQATGDTKYLDELARRADQAISHRDDRRNLADSTGRVHKAWTMASKYTVAEATLTDPAGRAAIKLRSLTFGNNNLTKVAITDAGADRFNMVISNDHYRRVETFSDLSLDPADARYVETVVNTPHMLPSPPAGTCREHSLLLRATRLADGSGGVKAQKLSLTPLPLSYMGYLGIIYHPMLRFAATVHDSPAALARYKPAADRIVAAADESYHDAEDLWHVGPRDDEGYYLFCARGGAFPWDNLGEPFNYLGGHVSAQLLLHRLTGKAVYQDHATHMANLLKRRLTPRDDGTYLWRYWYEPITTTGWTRENSPSDNVPDYKPVARIEDTSHGTFDVLLAINAAGAGIAFDKHDLRRFADTFLKHVAKPDRTGLNSLVDGSPGSAPVRTNVFGWLPLADVDPDVYRACRHIYESRNDDHFPSLARLLKYERRLTPPPTPVNNAP